MKKQTAIVLILFSLFALCSGCGKSEKEITNIDDVKHAKIGVTIGTTDEQIAQEMFPEADINRFDDVMGALTALKSDQVDAVISSYSTAEITAQRNPDLSFLPEPIRTEKLAIAVKKGNKELLAEVNELLAQLKQDGTLEGMKKRWFMEETTSYKKVDLPVPQKGEVLTVATNATLEPFSFVGADGEITGYEEELARRIAIKLNRPLKIVDMNFAALIPALQSGKVDMVISSMTATEERSKMVDFSQTYFEHEQMLIVRKPQEGAPGGAGLSFLKVISQGFYDNIIKENRYLLIIDGLKTTIIISILSALLGTLLGALICFMRMSKSKILYSTAKAIVDALRGTPVLVLLMLIFYVVFKSVQIDPVLVAVIAFGLNFGAYVSEMFRTAIQGVDEGQREAGIATGFTNLQVFYYIVLPQAIKRVLPVYQGEFISMIKMTSVVGYIAVQDLTKASDIIRSRTFSAFFPLVMVAILYFLIAWLLTLPLVYLEKKTDPKAKRRQVKQHDPSQTSIQKVRGA